MNKKRIVITGGSGLLALNWACVVRDNWEVVLATHEHSVNLRGVIQYKLDLEDITKLESQLEQLSSDLIVHTAGLTSVDHCEKNPALAEMVNATIAKNIAVVSKSKKIGLIHISTDHLFSGDSSFYSEDASPKPINEYARSKFLAEKLVQEAYPDALILRTNFFCWGYAQRQSLSDWIIYSLRNGKTLSMFDDVYITPILADFLVHFAHELVEKGASGIFNMVGNNRISKYEFALKLAKYFALPINLIERNKITNAQLFAPRPTDMSLNNDKLSRELGENIGSLDDYFSALRKQEVQGRRKELYNSVT